MTAADTFITAVRESTDFPAYDVPHARDELRVLEGMARRIIRTACETVDDFAAVSYGNTERPTDAMNIALMMAESLDAHLTSDAVGVIYAEIKSHFAVREAA